MTAGPAPRHHAREAYDALAPHYDAFTAHHDYDGWTATLERLARGAGLKGRRLLDVACGTGKSFLPFLQRGYTVSACDVSPRMARLAAAKAGGRARVEVRDMRELPVLGAFDLVCCLDDALNYLDSADELEAAFAGFRRNLAPGGVAVFDVNTLRSYRTFFATLSVVPAEQVVLVWNGGAPTDLGPGEVAEATLEVLQAGEAGAWTRTTHRHRQRHHPDAVIRAALAAAELDLAGCHGMRLDGAVIDRLDEEEGSKTVYVARRVRPTGRVRALRPPGGRARRPYGPARPPAARRPPPPG
jgi:SAM-dependent methyltransferase